MNKSMLIGIVAGVGVAVAGTVVGYSLFDERAAEQRLAVQQQCTDEEVATVADPTDPHRIAGTAVGAVVGGAVAKDVGDRNLTTIVGGFLGALIGRKVQEEVQDNRAEKRTVTTTERRCEPIGR
jgi:uncharacterized protein YcfJ